MNSPSSLHTGGTCSVTLIRDRKYMSLSVRKRERSVLASKPFSRLISLSLMSHLQLSQLCSNCDIVVDARISSRHVSQQAREKNLILFLKSRFCMSHSSQYHKIWICFSRFLDGNTSAIIPWEIIQPVPFTGGAPDDFISTES